MSATSDKHFVGKSITRKEGRNKVTGEALHVDDLTSSFTLAESVDKKDIIWGEDNVFKTLLVDKGNVDDVWAKADFVVEGEYYTGAQEQLYIENNGAMAMVNKDDGVTVWGSM